MVILSFPLSFTPLQLFYFHIKYFSRFTPFFLGPNFGILDTIPWNSQKEGLCMPLYLADYHTHTYISGDSRSTLLENITQAHRVGLSELCMTEHWNLLNQKGERLPTHYDFSPLLQQWEQLQDTWANRIQVRLGIELGNSTVDTAAVEEGLKLPELDFVIGSLHSMSLARDGVGIFTCAKACTDRTLALDVLEDYIQQMEALVEAGTFDVLGHIIYPLRYFPTQFQLSLEPWQDRLEEILKKVIESGKGMEFNTSQGSTIRQWIPLLTQYRALGGEIITLGSDAHRPEYIGAGFDQAVELLRSLGYRWVCTYRQRTPKFHSIM
ncbi:hypothetical protein B5G37_04270 [Pseudoflavonifractor sp. An85]|nr:hypothetical protein B5G37_04270 [Pseudoflavonifractor sp. An85]